MVEQRDDWVFGKHSPDQSRLFIDKKNAGVNIKSAGLPVDWPWSDKLRNKERQRAQEVTLADPKSPEEIEALKKNKANVERNKTMKTEELINSILAGQSPDEVLDEAIFQRLGHAVKRGLGHAVKRGVSAVGAGYRRAKRTFHKVRRKVKRYQLRRAIKTGQRAQAKQAKRHAYFMKKAGKVLAKQRKQKQRAQVAQRMARLRKGATARA